MVHVMNFARQYAEEIGGQFTDYDQAKAVVVVPLSDGRFQTVLAISRANQYGKERAVFISKICEFDHQINYRELLEQNLTFDYSKFVLEDGYLKIEASCIAATANEEQVKEMIMEVASLADQFEMKYTGQDVH